MTKTKTFKQTYTLEQRKTESKRIREKYPDRIPIIVEKEGRWTHQNLDRFKYLVPDCLTLGHFNFILRSRMKLKSEIALFLLCPQLNRLYPGQTLLTQIYREAKDEDGYLYLVYAETEAMGTN